MNLQEQKEFITTIQSALEEATSMELTDPKVAAELYLQISKRILDKAFHRV